MNPLAYGINYRQKEVSHNYALYFVLPALYYSIIITLSYVHVFNYQHDPNCEQHRKELILTAARSLNEAKMIRLNEQIGTLHPTDLGRTASHYYIKHATIQVFM